MISIYFLYTLILFTIQQLFFICNKYFLIMDNQTATSASKISNRLKEMISQEVINYLNQNLFTEPDMIELYDNMSDEDLMMQVGIIMSSQTQNPQYSPQRQTEQIQSIEIENNQQVEATEEMEDIVQIRNQMEEQRLQDYIKSMEINFQKYMKFVKSFSKEDMKVFEVIYSVYKSEELIAANKIKTVAKEKKKESNENLFIKQLLVVDSALYQSQGKRLRQTQILAIYCFLYKPDVQKMLLQILTGEGKSITIACLAAMLAMRGHKVDIITTNKILARRDAEEYKYFFSLMGLKVSHNLTNDSNKSDEQVLKPRKCYESDVVYGIPFTYQVDLLYDEYKRKGTRNNRKYDSAIVDEVDSMFVDEKQNQTLLASTYAGYSQLKNALKVIWETVLLHNIINEDGKLYLLQHGEKEGEIMQGEANQVMKLIINDLRQLFKNDVINKEKLEFIQISLENWIWNAIAAAHVYKENKHYIIQKGQIIPVDFSNTGCLQKNVQWEHGLHQFLQMKHGLHVDVEGLTSNYMSNIGHFCRYSKLYGLTGTLGSENSKQFLQKTYNVELLEIPPYHKRRLTINPGFLMYDENQWIYKILERCQFMMEQERAVLIICESIHNALTISQEIQKNSIRYKCIRLMITGEESHSDVVDCKDIVVATNVAGRGTDLKATQHLIEKNGLHVIITFMPANLRVQMQARGRAGRNGAPGSSELIVNLTEYCKAINLPLVQRNSEIDTNIQYFCEKVRDKIQAKLMEQDEIKVQNLRSRDKMFEIFCKAIQKVPDYQDNKAKRDAIQEQWAMLLKRCQVSKLDNQSRIQAAEQFSQKIINNSDSFYKLSHEVWLGIKDLGNQNLYGAKQHFRKVQTSQATNMAQAAGCIYQGSIMIKQNGKDRQNIKAGLQKMLCSIPKLQLKEDSLKAMSVRGAAVQDNRHMVEIIENQGQKELNNFIKESRSRRSISIENQQHDSSNLKIQNSNMNMAQVDAIQTLKKYLLDQSKKAQNLKKDEYLVVNYKPFESLINAEGKESNQRKVYEEMSIDLPHLPQLQVRKKKTEWWKRALAFVVGVIQICIGALIIANTCGAAANFGAFMIQSGITDCINAVFRPEVLQDLKKYYSGKAIQYGVAAAIAGTAAFAQMAKKGIQGFSFIKNSSMSEVLKTAYDKIALGLQKEGFDFSSIISQKMFHAFGQGSAEQMFRQQLKPKQVMNIIKSPNFKNFTDQKYKEEQKVQIDSKRIKQKFTRDSQKIIKNIVAALVPKFISQICQHSISATYANILIQNAFTSTFNQRFNLQNRQELYREILAYLSKNYEKQDLAEKFIINFKIDRLIKETIQNIKGSENYKAVINSSKNDIRDSIIEEYQKIANKYKNESQKLFDQLLAQKTIIQNSPLTQNERNQKIQNFSHKKATLDQKQNLLNSSVYEIKEMDKKGIVETLMSKKILINGSITKNQNDLNQVHQYLRQALQKFQSFEPSEQNFKQLLETHAYNSFVGITNNALIEVFDKFSNSAISLKKISEMLYKKESKNNQMQEC